jgi:uncharacterized membrane protein
MAIEHRALAALSIAFAASIAAYPVLPPNIPPLWRVNGAWVFIGAPFVAFLLPLTAAVIWWLFTRLNRHPLGSTSISTRRATGTNTGAATALFVSAFHVTMLIAFVGAQLWLARILGLTVGLFLIATGNELPRARRNLTWGIRTHQTLARDDVWRRVHRLAGYIRVASGMAVCVASLVAVPGYAELIVVAVCTETAVWVGAALFFSRQKTVVASARV